MPDLLAGTTVLAQDTPVAVEVEEGTNQDNISSTTYIAGSAVCATTFIAPTTGRIWVHLHAALRGDDTNSTLLSYEIYEGIDETGTLTVPTEDESRSVSNQNAEIIRVGTAKLESGLTPGATYFIRTMHRVVGGTTGDVLHRRVSVAPAT